jgi:UrcA family protein
MNMKMVAMITFLMISGTSAFAEDDAALSTTVHFSDLNLASPAGRAELNERTEVAVRDVCPANRFPGLSGVAPHKQCPPTGAGRRPPSQIGLTGSQC